MLQNVVAAACVVALLVAGVAASAADSDDDGFNQSFMAHTLPNAGPSVSTSLGVGLSLGVDPNPNPNPSPISTPTSFPFPSVSSSPELLLLHNDKFLTHFAQLLNITTENLTNLLGNSTNGSATTLTTDSMADESPTLLIVLTVCYAIIFVAGVLGNLITCIVISRNNFMHTATNFYLFNLAVSDLILLVSVAVAVAFFLCWAPFHAQRLMAVYGVSLINVCRCQESFNDYFRILDYTSGVLYFLSTCINPLLYNIMSHKFREAFKITLTRQFGLARNHHHQRSQYHQHNYSALMRLQGSMRLQPASCSVNNNALEPYGSYRVVQFRCRDANHQLSLQDSIRTNTTTTTINSTSQSAVGSAGVGVGGRRLRKHELYAATPCGSAVPHRLLQSQVSRMSSLSDANSHSLLETEVGGAVGRGKRTLLATNNGALLLTPSTESPAEENVQQPATTRLKLSRVISRRDEAAYSGSCSLPESDSCHSNTADTSTTEVRKFPWRKKRQKRNVDPGGGGGGGGGGVAGVGYATPKSL
ncbi:uncharacterized protein LOC117575391 isoform X3 [Drosophila albomicans]|uniref:Uncharacterized protein LOC117575391 isoform X3 n=1 Tax=Drosophila albomicans TaxID=7291 RepID=A0A9C6W7V0_DROAB|nr:uncharacterized protein LOC117575391 isoform X3 [Drosophila albomicans]